MVAGPVGSYRARMQALVDPTVITARQRQVVELIAQGMSNDEVGQFLGISTRTIYRKLDGVSDER